MIISLPRNEETYNHVWFTSDNHFDHANILRFCNRPFRDVNEMNEEMASRWNKVVKPDDTVYHLGDFTLGGPQQAETWFDAVMGKVRILGNPWHHDKRWLPVADNEIYKRNPYRTDTEGKGHRVEILPPMVVLEIQGAGKEGRPLAITLCHYPLAEWDRKHHGAIMLHGHSHGQYNADGLIMDVGVDCQNFYPVNLHGIISQFYDRGLWPESS